MNPEVKKHWVGYNSTFHKNDIDGRSRAFYTGDTVGAWFGLIRKWNVDNGHSSTRPGQMINEHGHLGTPIDFGLYDENGDLFRADRYNAATVAILDAQRADWPMAAKELCERYERKIYELLRALDKSFVARDAGDARVNTLTLQIAQLERSVQKAEETADELKRRVREVDIDRLRRDMAAEFSQKTEALVEENRRLASSLHEVTSQVTKLAEDKKKLRAALNTARGR